MILDKGRGRGKVGISRCVRDGKEGKTVGAVSTFHPCELSNCMSGSEFDMSNAREKDWSL